MNKIIIISFAFLYSLLANNEFVIDQTKAIIYNPLKTIIITQQDLQKQSLTHEPRTIENLCFEHLVALQTKAINLPDPDVSEVIKNIDEESIKQAGYSFHEFEEEVKRHQMVNMMLDFKIYSKVFVSQEEILAYFHQNPQLIDAQYLIQVAQLPINNYSIMDINHLLEKNSPKIAWQEPFWIVEKDLAFNKKFISSLALNTYKIIENKEYYEIYTVLAKEEQKITPLENRQHEIVQKLKKPLIEKQLEEYKKDILANKTYIIYKD